MNCATETLLKNELAISRARRHELEQKLHDLKNHYRAPSSRLPPGEGGMSSGGITMRSGGGPGVAAGGNFVAPLLGQLGQLGKGSVESQQQRIFSFGDPQ